MARRTRLQHGKAIIRTNQRGELRWFMEKAIFLPSQDIRTSGPNLNTQFRLRIKVHSDLAIGCREYSSSNCGMNKFYK
ncbi:hypothetical protein CEXT_804151 [Caerostris extrusa]|uniref:Uncharacterized protein n=1 Tax=Caerostris extrusa TaxID=172846 RepID=A0AAV4N2C4_CAEEX|nr:hypothetical protein CEXT_804151 [Caerostris extrusa]